MTPEPLHHSCTSLLTPSAIDKMLLGGSILKRHVSFQFLHFFSLSEGRKWKHSQTFYKQRHMSERKESCKGQTSTTDSMGLFRIDGRIPPGRALVVNPQQETKSRKNRTAFLRGPSWLFVATPSGSRRPGFGRNLVIQLNLSQTNHVLALESLDFSSLS